MRGNEVGDRFDFHRDIKPPRRHEPNARENPAGMDENIGNTCCVVLKEPRMQKTA